jgi:hypothetical protein
LKFLENMSKIKQCLKSKKNSEYCTWGSMFIYGNISLSSSQNEKHLRQNKFRIHILLSKIFSEICTVCEIMCKNKEVMEDNIIRRRKGAFCMLGNKGYKSKPRM